MSDTDTETETRPRVPVVAHEGRPVAIVPRDLDQVWRLATLIKKSGMAPTQFDTPEKISIAIMHGIEIGLTPMQSMQRIAVINGRPSVWGEAVPGLALATGLVEDWQERLDGEGDNMVASCTVKRKGVRSPTTATFSVADAKLAKLWGKQGPWQTHPKRMLKMRARVAFRDLFADALGGLYIAEEMIGEDMKDVTPVPVTPPQPPARVELPPPPKPDAAPVTHAVTTGVTGETVAPQVPLDGDVLPPAPASAKNKRPLPPPVKKNSGKHVNPPPSLQTEPHEAHPGPAQKGTPPMLTDEEAKVEADRLIDALDFCESEASLASWAVTNMHIKSRMPVAQWQRIEQAFNFKQAFVQKQEAK